MRNNKLNNSAQRHRCTHEVYQVAVIRECNIVFIDSEIYPYDDNSKACDIAWH